MLRRPVARFCNSEVRACAECARTSSPASWSRGSRLVRTFLAENGIRQERRRCVLIFAFGRAPPFLIAGDVAGATELRSLRWVRRSYGWIVPLSPDEIHPWSLKRLSQRVERARSTLEAKSFYFDLADPLQELGDAASRGRVAGTRLLLIGGEAVALLFAFAALAAAATRRESALTRWRLERAGARAFQTRLLTGAETVGLAGVATLLGWGLGIGVGAIVARVAGVPVGTVLSQSAASETGFVIALGLAVAAAGILALSFSARRSRGRSFALLPLTWLL